MCCTTSWDVTPYIVGSKHNREEIKLHVTFEPIRYDLSYRLGLQVAHSGLQY